MKRVILESPYAASERGSVADHERYAERALLDCLRRSEAPIASHLLFTRPGVLDDAKPHERILGMTAGHAWTCVADAIVVYSDYGISAGMLRGIRLADTYDLPVHYRSIGENPA